MHEKAAEPSVSNEELAEKAKAVLALQKEAIQRTLAVLADIQEAITRLEQRCSRSRNLSAA